MARRERERERERERANGRWIVRRRGQKGEGENL